MTTVGFLHGRSAYEPDPALKVGYVEHGFKQFSGDRTT